MNSVLIVDRDPETRALLQEALCHDGFSVDVANDNAGAFTRNCPYDVVIADIETVSSLVRADLSLGHVVVLTTAERLHEARGIIRRGAFDFVLRPFYIDEVSLTVASAAAHRRGRALDLPIGFVLKNHELHR